MINPFGDILGGLDLGKMFDGMTDEQREKTAGIFGVRCKCGETRDLKTWPPTHELVCGPCHLQKAIDFSKAS